MPHLELSAHELSLSLDDRRALRVLKEADADELYTVTEANRAYLAPWMPWAADQTLEGTLEFIRRVRQQLADNRGFAVALLQDGRIVGTMGFHRLDWANRSTSVGYWIAEAAQGQGTVTRALSALLDRAFGSWGLNRVEIRTAVDNQRSRSVARRLGFLEEGVLREAERFGDHYADDVLYAIVAGDWAGRRASALGPARA
jgi:ribosomal-protein-serine acetyltransferase